MHTILYVVNMCIFFIYFCSNKPNPAAINGKMNGVDGQVSGRACESCYGMFCNFL